MDTTGETNGVLVVELSRTDTLVNTPESRNHKGMGRMAISDPSRPEKRSTEQQSPQVVQSLFPTDAHSFLLFRRHHEYKMKNMRTTGLSVPSARIGKCETK